MRIGGKRLSPMMLFGIILVSIGVGSLLRPDASTSGTEETAAPCDVDRDPLCVTPGGDPGSNAPVLQASDVCTNDSGYLCAGLDMQNRIQLRRWKDFDGPIIVHIPRPTAESDGHSRRLQAAAAAGVRAWNGQPFAITVDQRGTMDAHFSVRWRRSLGGAQIGVARTRWSLAGGLEVQRIELATHSPAGGGSLDPESVRLVAAHEMGHALGILEHSDSERDVMYPSNTANALTARDYRTMDALYAVPDGAFVVR